MSIKSKRTITRIFATFLILSLTLCLFTISSSAAEQKYKNINDTVYYSADFYSLDELPYGERTAVVQINYYSGKWLTLYFDKLTIYNREDNLNVLDRPYSNLTDYYWSARYGLGGNINIEIDSDSPIYYTIYDNGSKTITDFQTIGELTTVMVLSASQTLDGTSTLTQKYYDIYRFYGKLSDIVGSNYSGSLLRTYSNVFMIGSKSLNDEFGDLRYYYFPVPFKGYTSTHNQGSYIGYDVAYYPTSDYLFNTDIRDLLTSQYDELKIITDSLITIAGDTYMVNYYLSLMEQYQFSMMTDLQTYLPLMESTLIDIYDVLSEIKTGPEYDSSQGIGSNTEFGDTAGGLMQDTEVPSIGTDSIQSNLGSSFLFIRNMFDWVTGNFNLVYIISFLLGLSFIAYVLGRVIKNKMNG